VDDADDNSEPTLEESVAEIDAAMLNLSIAQIEDLVAEQDDEAQRMVLQHFLQRRQDIEQAIVDAVHEVAEPLKKRTGGIRTSEPGELASGAAALFMEDDGKVSVWQEAVAEATDESGSVVLTGRIVQLAIGAYYAERRAARKRSQDDG
jgi:hypothetical protein